MSEVLASDAEREAAVERLRTGAGEGRLEHEELERRVHAAYAARTRAELEAVTADLPPPPAPRPRMDVSGEELRRRTAGFLVPNVVCLMVWVATGAGYFWPGWVLLGTGIAFVVWLIRVVLGVDDDDAPRRLPP
ncbi:MAG TPA: DUF1707 domain-containing protein [Solirubrobacteraceae bacterium]|jgi:hypothetical protein